MSSASGQATPGENRFGPTSSATHCTVYISELLLICFCKEKFSLQIVKKNNILGRNIFSTVFLPSFRKYKYCGTLKSYAAPSLSKNLYASQVQSGLRTRFYDFNTCQCDY
jgi:hypothetical protein